MSSSRSAQRCSAVVSWASVGSETASGGSAPDRSTHPLSEDQRRVAVGGCGRGGRLRARAGRRGPWGGDALGGRYALLGAVAGGGAGRGGVLRLLGGPFGGRGEGGLGQRCGEDRGDLGAGSTGRRRADPADLLGAHGLGDPRPVQDAPLVGLGDQVLGLVVVAVGGLHGPQVDGDAVLLGGHHARQQVAVAGHQDDVGAGAVAGQLGQFGVHGGVHALLRPAAVTAREGAEPDGDPGHDAQAPVFGLRDAVGGAVEPGRCAAGAAACRTRRDREAPG